MLSTDGTKAYVSNNSGNWVAVVNLASGSVKNLETGAGTFGMTRSPDGYRIYVANRGANTVSVINAITDTVTATSTVAMNQPIGVSTNPSGSKLYVTNQAENVVRVLDALTLAQIATVNVGSGNASVGQFIAPGIPAPPPPPPEGIPTMTEWAVILFGLALLSSAMVLIRRRRMQRS